MRKCSVFQTCNYKCFSHSGPELSKAYKITYSIFYCVWRKVCGTASNPQKHTLDIKKFCNISFN